MTAVTLGEIAQRFGLKLVGDAGVSIDGVCSLLPGRAGGIAFLNDAKLRDRLGDSAASAGILRAR